MAPQFDYFQRTHRVLSVDLRGHGQSDKPHQDYTMAAFADDLAWLCDERGLKKPVVVGHSMGGVIAVELARQFPELPGAVVTLDSPVVPPQVGRAGRLAVAEALRGPDYQKVQQEFVEKLLFIAADDPALKARVVREMSSAPQYVMASAFAHTIRHDTDTAVAACKVPLLVLAAASWLSDVSRLQELCPYAVLGQTVGAGHFHQLEVPEQVNAMIERFMATAL
jgi:pimeloyl-ACP methyl ester carboxylesterase